MRAWSGQGDGPKGDVGGEHGGGPTLYSGRPAGVPGIRQHKVAGMRCFDVEHYSVGCILNEPGGRKSLAGSGGEQIALQDHLAPRVQSTEGVNFLLPGSRDPDFADDISARDGARVFAKLTRV